MDNKSVDPVSESIEKQALTWAFAELELESFQELEESEFRRAAMASFFNNLRSNDFYAEEESAEAVEVVCGKSPYLVPGFTKHQKEQQLAFLDDVVEWFANKLGEQDTADLRDQLDLKLSEFSSQASLSDVRNYASQIHLAAQAIEMSSQESSRAAQSIARAVFQIAAVRSTKRRQTRSRLVRRLHNEYSRTELVEGKRVLARKYKIPNDSFHRPFLNLLTWEDDHAEEFRIAPPVASNTQTVVAYSKNFGVASPAGSAGANSNQSNWGWLAFVIFFAGIGIASGWFFDSKKDSQNNVTPSQFPPKVAVIVFDKDDPNKYAVEFVSMAESFGRTTVLEVSEEHPGPFVYVQLSEINRDPAEEKKVSEKRQALEDLLNGKGASNKTKVEPKKVVKPPVEKTDPIKFPELVPPEIIEARKKAIEQANRRNAGFGKSRESGDGSNK